MAAEQRTADINARKKAVMQGRNQVQHKIWVRDDWAYYDVWQVPIESLVLNIDNKRFASERAMVEHKLGRPLDPSNNPGDQESIVAILCDSSIDVDPVTGVASGTPSKDFQALRDDFRERNQAEPLWIRPDGTVRNGNRRLAMLQRLRAEGEDRNWVDAIILSVDDVDEPELFRMEQREQLTENFKKRYQDVNALLALRAAAELEQIDWRSHDSITQVGARLKHYAGRDDAGYAVKQLYAIRAMDQYLDYIGAPDRYSLAHRQVEVFREVGLCMTAYLDEPDQQFELVHAAFAFAQAGRGYRDIRNLRKMFATNRALFDGMVAEIQGAETDSGWDSEDETRDVEYPELADVTAETEDENDDDSDDLPITPTSYPQRPVSSAIDNFLDRFDAESFDVYKQLEQAYARLEAIDHSALSALDGPGRDTARAALAQIEEITANLRSALG